MSYQSKIMQGFMPLDHLLFTLFLFGIFFVNHACNQTDRNSLLSLPFHTSSPPLNWSSVDCCHWEGISCDHKGQVTDIWLPSKGLIGTISPSLGNLTSLSHLNLSQNSLSGSLPNGLFSSSNQLKVLDLSYNHISGDIRSISGLPASIQIVDISSNRLCGRIEPSFLQRALSLINLNVSNNGFTGPIPSSPCIHSPFVMLLDFSHNHHDGQVPSGLGECSKLKVFRAGFNSLTGSLPSNIYSATELEEISLPSNDLSGPIKNDISNLTKLTIIELYDNKLSGKLPQNIGKLSRLRYMLLHMNCLIGSLPPFLMNCTNLVKLNLRYNFFGGDISAVNFSSLQQLTILDLGFNEFNGNLPASLFSCKSLRSLRLCRNQLEGQIQPKLLQLKFLSLLSLAHNRLTNITGAIKIMMHCKTLSIVFLNGNFLHEVIPADGSIVGSNGCNLRLLSLDSSQLTGQLPIWLSKLKKLEVLNLGFNRITGSIPGWLSTLPRLFYIDLSNNLISGEFPKELCGLLALVSEQARTLIDHSYLDLPIFFSSNGIYSQYNYLSNMPQGILIGNNNISGNIPVEISRLRCLRMLNLSHNNFSGSIPNQISELTNLEELGLSGNQLSGEIPTSLASLHFLSQLSVANNNLHGSIPSGTQLQSFSASSYEGNLGLCGPPLPKCDNIVSNNGDKNIHDEEDELRIPWFPIIVVLGFITGFWGVCGPLLFSRKWRVAYFQFLDNIKDRFHFTTAMCLAGLSRRSF
ncbi:receptor-like protein 3 [Corylus avellana]|uniref:receptor-like protein 3 n=1 Tax=Corylus avellana TaxID=13451 RepID=UPI001E234E8D|nr:receptor-like protein 3 [Corylus avellana]